jgi:hypothetical protein
MPIQVPVKDIVLPRRVDAFVFNDRTTTVRSKMEVYTGWVRFEWYRGDEGVGHEEVVSFVPFAPQFVQPYRNEPLEIAVTAAPSAFADDDDEANVVAVDDASVALESQTFEGVAGPQFVLVLRATIGALSARILGFTYQVTVLEGRPNDQELEPVRIGANVRPR